MGLQAAEQLVTELAASRVGTDFKPTEGQKELNVPTFLVYLFGIVIAEDEYQRWRDHKKLRSSHGTSHHFSPNNEKRFCAFQKKYFASANIASVHGVEQRTQTTSPLEPKPYKLTRRIFPSKDQQAIVKRDLLKECEKLEYLSNEALEALLMEESSSSYQALTKTKRRTRKKTGRDEPTANRRSETVVIKDGEEGKKESAKEVVATSLPHHSVDRLTENNACIGTKNKCYGGAKEGSSLLNRNALISNLPTNQVVLKTEFCDSMTKDEGFALIKNIGYNPNSSNFADNSSEKKVSSSTNLVSHVDSLMYNLSSLPTLPSQNLPSSITPSDHISLHSTIDTSVLTKQAQRITDLEHDLGEANRQSKEERLMFNKALRKEKERYENLIQALQLRLYISENKVRTYEDALEKHIESISAINNSSCATKRNDYEERMPSSPSLISKVLENTRVARNQEI